MPGQAIPCYVSDFTLSRHRPSPGLLRGLQLRDALRHRPHIALLSGFEPKPNGSKDRRAAITPQENRRFRLPKIADAYLQA